MKLNYITVRVRKLEESIRFYEDLAGLHIRRRMEVNGGSIAFLGNAEGETMLELIEFPEGEKVEAKGMVMSYLSEDELESLREKAISLGYNPSEMIASGKKPKYFTVMDPDGITVEFSK